MEVSSICTLATPENSIFSLTQSAGKRLIGKYSTQFSFYLGKGINQIVFNDSSKPSILNFKDVMTFSEDTEYLKRYYRVKNNQDRNQVKDRFVLLRNYYATSDLLRYEYPMMIIHRKKDLFLKRHKQHNKLKKQQQSSSSSQSQSSIQSEGVFAPKIAEEDHLVDLDWTQIFVGKYEQEKFDGKRNEKQEVSFDQEYSIYDSDREIKRQDFLRKMGILEEKNINLHFRNKEMSLEKELDHLIVDFDDLDKKHVVQQYNKLINKENELGKQSLAIGASEGHKIKSVFESRKPLSSSIIIPGTENKNSQRVKYQNLNKSRQSMLIGSREQRFQQTQLIKKSSLLESQRLSNHPITQSRQFSDNNLAQQSIETQIQDLDRYFLPRREGSTISDAQFLTATFGKKRKDIMKVSEIATDSHDHQTIEVHAQINKNLLRVKQMPIQFYHKKKECGLAEGQDQEVLKQREKKREEKKIPSKGLNRVKSLQSFEQTPTNLAFVKKSKYR